jgi:hypothetical protein
LNTLDIYQHDSPTMFRFVLRGDLKGACVDELEHAWTTAISVLKGKELVVDISAVASADQTGLDLLDRMRVSGARMTAPAPTASPDLVTSLGIPVASTPRPVRPPAKLGLTRWLVRLSGLSG